MFGRRRQERAPTVIGADTDVEGSIHSDEDIRVDGRLDGSVESSAAVVVGGSGLVRGDVIGDDVTIAGRVLGRVIARGRLRMEAGGTVEGDALYGSLEVEHGGALEGSASRSVPPGAEVVHIGPGPEPTVPRALGDGTQPAVVPPPAE